MRILLIEDEPEMAAVLATALSQYGLVVDHVGTAALALEAAALVVHDVVLLDRHLPDGDGLSLVPRLRKTNPGVPILMLTAFNEPTDRVQGLDGGADDYLGKPFQMVELIARIRALMRRPSQVVDEPTRRGSLAFDFRTLEAFVNAAPLELPRRELLVLEMLFRRFGRTVTRSALEEAVYGFDEAVQSNALDSHVSRLRRKLADAGADVTVHAIRGVGYLMKASA